MPALLSTLLLAHLALGAGPPQDAGQEVTARYHEAAEAQDHAGLVALWRAHPELVLVTIDADLEASLRLRESSPDEPDEASIAALQRRALAGARAATEATGEPIFVDYASAFVGWDAAQQLQFRAGQQAFGEAREALAAGDEEAAEAAARRCIELAEPLGDWWGTAMGESVLGRVLVMTGRLEEALVPLGRARLIHHDLGLLGSEYGNLMGLVDVLAQLGHDGRCVALAGQAIELGRRLGEDEAVARLEELQAGLRAGLDGQAPSSR